MQAWQINKKIDLIDQWIDDLNNIADDMDDNKVSHLSAHIDSITADLEAKKLELLDRCGGTLERVR